MSRGYVEIEPPLFGVQSNWRPPKISDLPSWKGAKRIGLDTETHDPNLNKLGIGVRRDGRLVGISFALEDGPSHYLPLYHYMGDNVENVEHALAYVRDNAKHFEGSVVGAHLPYDLDYLAEDNIVFPKARDFRDVQIADPLINELQSSYSLEAIAQRWGLPGKDETMLREAAWGHKLDPKVDMHILAARYVGPYAIQDAVGPLAVLRKQEREIESLHLGRVYTLECAVLPVLLKMRRRGVRIDMERLERIEAWAISEEQKALDEIKRLTGFRLMLDEVATAGPLGPVLRSIGVRLPKTAKTDKDRIDIEVLAGITHPVGACIARGRKVNKLRRTFVASVRRFQTKGRIHGTLNQLRGGQEFDTDDAEGAAYGRLSGSKPNLQQQPSRDDFASEWRSIYLPEPGKLWASKDYCFSADTEILTRRGWIMFPSLQENDDVAQWDDAGEVSFAAPLARQVVEHSGEMIHVFGQRSVDILMSPNHRCLLYSNSTGKLNAMPASEYKCGSSGWRQRTAGTVSAGSQESADLLRLVVAIQADSAIRGKKVRSVRFWFNKQRKIARLLEILTRLGIPFSEYDCAKKVAGHAVVFTPPAEVWKYLTFEKEFIREALVSLDLSSRQVFINETLLWDGNLESKTYNTSVSANAHVVQELAILSGHTSVMSLPAIVGARKQRYTVSVREKQLLWTDTFTKEILPARVQSLYCVTMPLGSVVVRRKGRVAFTGQCAQEPRMMVHLAVERGRALMGDEAYESALAMQAQYLRDPTTDFHDMTTRAIGWPSSKRKGAKTIGLGLAYGMGEAKLCSSIGLPLSRAVYDRDERRRVYRDIEPARYEILAAREGALTFAAAGPEGREVLERFNAGVPFLRRLATVYKNRAEETGVVRTISGRLCHFPEKREGAKSYGKAKWEWTHKALNRAVQGSSGDQTKRALVDLDREGIFVQLQIHDEVASSVANDAEAKRGAEIMENAWPLHVPSLVDVEIGRSWGEAR
jgi:DNA polymerase I-like protein with 3'-5' exonuclease and polymerase domains